MPAAGARSPTLLVCRPAMPPRQRYRNWPVPAPGPPAARGASGSERKTPRRRPVHVRRDPPRSRAVMPAGLPNGVTIALARTGCGELCLGRVVAALRQWRPSMSGSADGHQLRSWTPRFPPGTRRWRETQLGNRPSTGSRSHAHNPRSSIRWRFSRSAIAVLARTGRRGAMVEFSEELQRALDAFPRCQLKVCLRDWGNTFESLMDNDVVGSRPAARAE